MKSVDLYEIKENDFVITPGRYVGIKELSEIDLNNAVKLGDVLELNKPSRLVAEVEYKKITIK